MNEQLNISEWSKNRLHEQGWRNLTNNELGMHRFGIRFAYILCMCLVVSGLAFGSQTLLIIANIMALLGTLPPYHPIDYIYNYGFRFFVGRPKLPPRSAQGRFACYIASAMLIVINYFFYTGNMTVVYIVGLILITSAFLVGFFDLCVPSLIYNAIFENKKKQTLPEPQINPE